MSTSHVIIGDGIAGSSAAETIREADPDADVTVITDEGEALYNRILIKEFAKGKLPEAPISIHEPEWYDERDIALELDTHVTNIDTDAHEIHTHSGDVYGYDKLLIATGGTPSQLPVDDSDADGLHHFWTFQDARKIREHAEEAGTDDDSLVGPFGVLADGARVLKRPEVVDALGVGVVDRQLGGRPASRYQQLVVLVDVALVGTNLVCAGVDSGDVGVQFERDIAFLVPFGFVDRNRCLGEFPLGELLDENPVIQCLTLVRDDRDVSVGVRLADRLRRGRSRDTVPDYHVRRAHERKVR